MGRTRADGADGADWGGLGRTRPTGWRGACGADWADWAKGGIRDGLGSLGRACQQTRRTVWNAHVQVD